MTQAFDLLGEGRVPRPHTRGFYPERTKSRVEHEETVPLTTFIVNEYLSALAQGFEAKPVDSGENVVVLIPDDDGVFYMANAGYVGEHRMPCTQPVQTYVDVFHCGGRGQEAAEAALEQRRKPERKQRGLL